MLGASDGKTEHDRIVLLKILRYSCRKTNCFCRRDANETHRASFGFQSDEHHRKKIFKEIINSYRLIFLSQFLFNGI